MIVIRMRLSTKAMKVRKITSQTMEILRKVKRKRIRTRKMIQRTSSILVKLTTPTTLKIPTSQRTSPSAASVP